MGCRIDHWLSVGGALFISFWHVWLIFESKNIFGLGLIFLDYFWEAVQLILFTTNNLKYVNFKCANLKFVNNRWRPRCAAHHFVDHHLNRKQNQIRKCCILDTVELIWFNLYTVWLIQYDYRFWHKNRELSDVFMKYGRSATRTLVISSVVTEAY